MALPLTPSDHPDFQKKHTIKPDDEFIVMMDGLQQHAVQELTKVFNKHGHGKITVALTGTFFVKDMTWPIVNELRSRKDVRCCGPSAGKLGPM
jgi:hypothetical protein